MSQFYKVLNLYFNCSEFNQYDSLFNEKALVISILKSVPLVFVYLDIIVMGYESFAFTNLIGSSIGSISRGPKDSEKLHFSDLRKLCFTGMVISIIHLTYLSVFDIIIDIFYCHELKRVVNNGDSESQSGELPISSGGDLNVSLLIKKYRQEGGNTSQIVDEMSCSERLILENTVSPLRVPWIKYFVASTCIMKSLHFVSLENDEDINEINIRNELFLSTYNSDIYFNKYIIVPRVLPVKISEASKWSIYRLLFLYSTILVVYQFLDILLKFSIMYLLIQIPFWPWNLLITITLQLIFMGLCFSFHNSPITNLIIGLFINIFGVLPLLLSSQRRIKHNVSISCSLLSLRSMEFLISILLNIIIPFNSSGADMQLLHENTNQINLSTYLHAINNYFCKNDVATNFTSNSNLERGISRGSGLNIGNFFWIIIAIFFIHEMLLFVIQKVIMTPKSRDDEYLSDIQNNRGIEVTSSMEYLPYFRFI
ncbi:transmembrane domain-containing protein [Cryptosporidium canis]|uniref:Transmembrane domain-containing protein n=1 Tax=Cryptosporidium canis TaxID=195482 RepID=A0A9D5DKG5_9CRYT|nr:transmembrane domain-containing protein [Cryptosporidium canis]